MASTKKRKYLLFVCIIFFILGLFYIFFNENGILKYLRLKSQLNSLKEEVGKVDDNNKKLQGSIDSLRSKVPAKIEKVAREKYNMIRKGEKNIKIIEK